MQNLTDIAIFVKVVELSSFTAAAEALDGRPLTIRTLDVGADKRIPGIQQPHEANPFLGVRGIRLALERPDVFGPQLRAIARVAADHDVRILLPMIATVDELHRALAALDDRPATGRRSGRPGPDQGSGAGG